MLKHTSLFIVVAIISALFTPLHGRVVVSGTVTDSRPDPIYGASVALLHLPDSVYVCGAITDSKGDFALETPDEYDIPMLLVVHAYGYDDHSRLIDANVSKPLDIVLHEQENVLNEVVVTGKTPVLKNEGGKFIFIPNDLRNMSADAFGVLKLSPMITSESDNNIEILGRSKCKFLINGSPVIVSNEVLFNYLRALPPKTIQSIEIIVNPGASEESGTGIINIVMKEPSEGLIGALSSRTEYYHERVNQSGNLWLGFNKHPVKVSATIAHTASNNVEKQQEVYEYFLLGKTVRNNTSSSLIRNALMGGINMEYKINRRSNLQFAFNMGATEVHGANHSTTITTINDIESKSYFNSKTKIPMKQPWTGVVLQYIWRPDKKGSMLTVSADYSHAKGREVTDMDNSGVYTTQENNSASQAFRTTVKYNHIFSAKMNLTAGYEFSGTHIDLAQYLGDVSDNFKYLENSNNAYLQLQNHWSDKITSGIGLRMDHVHVAARQIFGNERSTNNYVAFLPNVSVDLSLPGAGHSISLYCSPTLSKPFYSQLNPFKNWTSDNTYKKGNPDLRPFISLATGVYYHFLKDFMFNASYSYAEDVHTEYTINTPDGMAVTSYSNQGRCHNVMLNLQYTKMLTSFWHLKSNLSSRYGNQKVYIENQNIGYNQLSASLTLTNSFTFSQRHNFRGSIFYCIDTPYKALTRTMDNWRHMLSLSIEKMFNFGLYVSVSAFCPFGQDVRKRYDTTPEFHYMTKSEYSYSSCEIRLRYVFGKKTVEASQNTLRTLRETRDNNN